MAHVEVKLVAGRIVQACKKTARVTINATQCERVIRRVCLPAPAEVYLWRREFFELGLQESSVCVKLPCVVRLPAEIRLDPDSPPFGRIVREKDE